MSISEPQVAEPTPVVVEPTPVPEVPMTELPESGTEEAPTPEPPVEGEAAPPSFDDYLESSSYKSEYESRIEDARRSGDKDGWRKYEAATRPATDELRDTLRQSFDGLSALEAKLTNLVGSGELEPEQAAPIIKGLQSVSSWTGVQAALNMLGQVAGDDSIGPVFWGRKYNEVKRQSVDPNHRDETWGTDLMAALLEGAPEEVVKTAARHNAALKTLRKEAYDEGHRVGLREGREAAVESEKAEARGQPGAGPDATPARSGGGGINTLAEAERRYNLPLGHPERITHDQFKAERTRFGVK